MSDPKRQPRELSDEEQDAHDYVEERAAILEYEAGMPRHIAEATARAMWRMKKEKEKR